MTPIIKFDRLDDILLSISVERHYEGWKTYTLRKNNRTILKKHWGISTEQQYFAYQSVRKVENVVKTWLKADSTPCNIYIKESEGNWRYIETCWLEKDEFKKAYW